jgi:hypothetical protein
MVSIRSRLLLPLTSLMLISRVSHADYARPPDGTYDRYDHYERREAAPDAEPHSTVRLFTGPVLRLSDEAARGGLALALDVGARAAGVRFSSAWVRTGSDHGFAQYGGELWVDFGKEEPFHPILAAGAAVARLDGAKSGSHVATETIGVGLLRATIQYRLPVDRVDARAALDVVGGVPAVGVHAGEASPWALATLFVGVGF